MSSRVKYVQLEAGDFLADPDFQLMTDAERGIYCSIIFYMYRNDGKIEDDPNRIKTLANAGENFEKNWNCVRKKFVEKNGFLTHKRVRKELVKAEKYFQTQRKAGLRGAEKRWGCHNDPNRVDIPRPMANKVKESKVKEYSPNSDEIRLASLLLDLILERKPNFRKPNLQKWVIHIDRLIRLDNRTPEQIEKVIHWCQQDDFWQNNILSTEKLRKQIDKLELAIDKHTPTIAPLERGSDGLTPGERAKVQMEEENAKQTV